MKLSNVIDLTRILAANLKRGVLAPKIYDYTRVFELPKEAVSDDPKQRDALDYNYERDVLTLASAGRWTESEWRKGESLEDHSRLFKGVVAALIKSLGGVFSVGKSDEPFLHPGMQASIKMGRNVVGFFGVIHPAIREAYDLKVPGMFGELDLRLVTKFSGKTESVAVSDFPIISRDMTLMIDRKDQAGRVLRLIKDAQMPALKETRIVDDFLKPEESFRRVTYRIVFQSADRTLKHEEVDAAMTTLLAELRDKHSIGLA
jgi:phenylalanyl-tRNA synthetase beta chain